MTVRKPRINKKSKHQRDRIFVVQKHWARNLHYDFRLEMHGTLWSWAVPKGVPLVKGQRRLAMRTENHAKAYAGFEGVIPEGKYGAGRVKIWDKGTYSVVEKTKNKIVINFKGKKLKGEYCLVMFRPPKNWLFFKK